VQKKSGFQPSTHVIDAASFGTIMSNSWQAEALVRQRAIKLCEQEKIGKKLQYYKAIVERWMWWQPLPVKLLSRVTRLCQQSSWRS
jgi:hypothetical protein